MNNNHASDCAVHSEPAYPAGPCDCHLSIALRLDELMTHSYQGSSEAADKIAAELVEIYKSMQPAMNPCAGRNCGSTNPNLHSAECFEDYEKATGMTMQEPVAMRYDFDGYGYQYIDNGSGSDWMTRINDAEPLYRASHGRQWQSLTDSEISEVLGSDIHAEPSSLLWFIRAIEDKLREKNT